MNNFFEILKQTKKNRTGKNKMLPVRFGIYLSSRKYTFSSLRRMMKRRMSERMKSRLISYILLLIIYIAE